MEEKDQLQDNNIEKLHVIKLFLPVLFQDESEENYIKTLTLAAHTSYENGLYQFACVQYHKSYFD